MNGDRQGSGFEHAHRHAAAQARHALSPRGSVRPPARPPAARWDVAAASLSPATRNAALRSGLEQNGFVGSLASWITSLVKLTRLYAPVTAGAGSTGALAGTAVLCVAAPALRQRAPRFNAAPLRCACTPPRTCTRRHARTHTHVCVCGVCTRVCTRMHARTHAHSHHMLTAARGRAGTHAR